MSTIGEGVGGPAVPPPLPPPGSPPQSPGVGWGEGDTIGERGLRRGGGPRRSDRPDLYAPPPGNKLEGSHGVSNPHFVPSVRLALLTAMLELSRVMAEARLREGLLSAEQEERIAAWAITMAKEIRLEAEQEAQKLLSEADEAMYSAIASLAAGIAQAGLALGGAAVSLKGAKLRRSANEWEGYSGKPAADMRYRAQRWEIFGQMAFGLSQAFTNWGQAASGFISAHYKIEQADIVRQAGLHRAKRSLAESLMKAIERFQQSANEARRSYGEALNKALEEIEQAIKANLAAHGQRSS